MEKLTISIDARTRAMEQLAIINTRSPVRLNKLAFMEKSKKFVLKKEREQAEIKERIKFLDGVGDGT